MAQNMVNSPVNMPLRGVYSSCVAKCVAEGGMEYAEDMGVLDTFLYIICGYRSGPSGDCLFLTRTVPPRWPFGGRTFRFCRNVRARSNTVPYRSCYRNGIFVEEPK